MKCINSVLGLLVALALFATACTSGSTDVAESATPTAVEAPTEVPTETPGEPTPTEVPTEVPLPEVTDQDRIDAVIAAMDAAMADGTAPNGSIAYDLLDSRVSDESGSVTLVICEWTGDTVYDTVRDSLWRTSVADDGTIATEHVTTSVAQGDCTNTHMIETALAAIEEFDLFWQEFTNSPELFASDDRSSELLGDGLREQLSGITADFLESDTRIRNSRIPGRILDNSEADLLWRTYERNEVAVVEFSVCREMVEDRGVYRDEVLVDDGKPDDLEMVGPHSIDAFQVRPRPEMPGEWLVVGRAALIWANCFGVDDWAQGASDWKPAPTDFVVLDQ